MKKFDYPIPYMKHLITEEDKEYVVKALESDFITQGPFVELVEKEMAKLTSKNFSVMCANGTAALHLVAEMLNQNIKKNNKNIVTTSLTFVADANFGRYINADVKFADIDNNTWTISPESVESTVDENTVAVVAPHFGGLMCDIEKIAEICKDKNIYLVEDACHAPTASRNNVISGSIGDVSTFSFHATKHIGSGEGGVVCTNSIEEQEKLNTLRSHGLPHWSKRTGFGYDIDEMAFNYRPSEMSAALAYSHIQRLEELIESRSKIAKIYDNNLNWNFYSRQVIPQNSTHVYHLYPILVPKSADRDRCLQYLKDLNIFAQIHYPPISKMTGFKNYYSNSLIAEDIGSRIISIPMFPQMKDEEIDFVIEQLNNFSNN